MIKLAYHKRLTHTATPGNKIPSCLRPAAVLKSPGPVSVFKTPHGQIKKPKALAGDKVGVKPPGAGRQCVCYLH